MKFSTISLICLAALAYVNQSAASIASYANPQPRRSSLSSSSSSWLTSFSNSSSHSQSSSSSLAPQADAPVVKKVLDEPQLPADAPVALLYLHGLGESSNDLAMRVKGSGLRIAKTVAVDFPCSAKNVSEPTWLKNEGQRQAFKTAKMFAACCFAQEAEQEVVVAKYLELVRAGFRVVIMGQSNGGANAITTAGSYVLKNCDGLIVLSAYGDPINVAERLTGPRARSAIVSLGASSEIMGATAFKPSGPTPLKLIGNIDKKLPLLLGCSQQDGLIVAGQTETLNKAAVAAGLKVDFAKLPYGAHGNIEFQESGDEWRARVQAWALKHRIPQEAPKARL